MEQLNLVEKIIENILHHQKEIDLDHSSALRTKGVAARVTHLEMKKGAGLLGVDGKAVTLHLGAITVGFVGEVYNKIFERKHKPKILTANILESFINLHQLGLDQSKNLSLIGKLFLLDLASQEHYSALFNDVTQLYELEKFIHRVFHLFLEKKVSKELYLFYIHKTLEICLDKGIDFSQLDVDVYDNEDDFSPIMIQFKIGQLPEGVSLTGLDKIISQSLIEDRKLSLSEKMKIILNLEEGAE